MRRERAGMLVSGRHHAWMLGHLLFLLCFGLAPCSLRSSFSEELGPSSKVTPLVISEIMYHPATRADGRNLEFIEIYNAGLFREDLSGFRLSGEVDFIFPPGTVLSAGEFLVVARSAIDLQLV